MRQPDLRSLYIAGVRRELVGWAVFWMSSLSLVFWVASLLLPFADGAEILGTVAGFPILRAGLTSGRPAGLLVGLGYLAVPVSGLVGFVSRRSALAVAALGLAVSAFLLASGGLHFPRAGGGPPVLASGVLCLVASAALMFMARLVAWRSRRAPERRRAGTVGEPGPAQPA